MNGDRLRRVDSVMHYAVGEGMTPGGQILIARSGKVIYHKAFGYHTDKKEQRVALDDMYDLASLTKILSTLPLVMELVESGVISLEANLGQLLPEFKASNKGRITIKEMLSHYARLEPWIPFYEHTLDTASLKPNLNYYRYQKQPGFQVEVAKDLYMRTDYTDSIYKIIKESDLLKRRRYRYSDLPYYLLKNNNKRF